MGENLALNMAGKGFTVSVFDALKEKVENFVSAPMATQSAPLMASQTAPPRPP